MIIILIIILRMINPLTPKLPECFAHSEKEKSGIPVKQNL